MSGAYAAFIWPAFALSGAVLTALTLEALLAGRRWKAELARREKEAGGSP